MAAPFEVHPYSIGVLKQLLAEKSGAPLDIVHGKVHSLYFEEYFSHLGARTILVENGYIDHDFLEDYAGYYVRCFHPYRRKCSRLHFFRCPLTQEAFEQIIGSQLTKGQVDSLQSDYLGFVVVKPLPQTVVGRTCLRTYEHHQRRFYPVTRHYPAHLFGIPLGVETLAFQEQDRVTAACATSALWSVFHATGVLFQHQILSPVEITRAAHAGAPTLARSLPSHGLHARQIAHAICSVGLEPVYLGAQDEYMLKARIYSYLRFGIPVLLIVDLYDLSEAEPVFVGAHAVAVTGYSLATAAPAPNEQTGFLLNAARVEKLYVHDDQVGPFARMVLDGTTISTKVNGETAVLSSLSTSWNARCGGGVRAAPDLMLVPVYHKIRIPFDLILSVVMGFDALLERLRAQGAAPLRSRPVWDICLCKVSDMKQEALLSAGINPDQRKEIALAPMPRFLWRGTASAEDAPMLDLLFDATDIEQGPLMCRAIEYDRRLGRFLRWVARVPGLEQVVRTRPERRILDWFKDQPL
jgi:hypothetical protein